MTYSIIQKSQLKGALRLDAEYYQPEYLNLISKIKSQKSKLLKDFLKLLYRYPTFYNLQYHTSGVLVLKGEDILPEGFIQNQSQDYISEEDASRFPKTILKEGDLIFSVRGYVGKVGLVDKKYEGSIISVNLIRAVIKVISPYFLWVYLNSKYGIKQIDRAKMITAQETIIADDIKNFLVPVINKEKQAEIENLAKQAIKEVRESESLYSQAENLLLEELGLKDFEIEDDLSYIVNLSDMKSSHRADAEYFQPKYNVILNKLSKRELDTIINNFDLIRGKNFEYTEEGEIGVIQTKQLGKQFIKLEVENRTKKEIVNKEGLPILNDRDVVFASMGIGSLGKTNIFYNFEATETKYTIDSTLRIFRGKNQEFLPEVLVVYLNSFVGQELIYKYIVGTSGIISIYEDYLKEFPVPILPKPTQQKIADLVQKSHEARKKAKELLEEAIKNLLDFWK